MEIREVKTKQVDERCPVCGNGYMRPTGIVTGGSGSSQLYPHKCTVCKYQQTYTVRYPYIIHE